MAPGGRRPCVLAIFLPHRLGPTLGMAERFGNRRIVESALQDAPHIFVGSRKRRKVGDAEAQDLTHIVLLQRVSCGEDRLRTNPEQARIVRLEAGGLLRLGGGGPRLSPMAGGGRGGISCLPAGALRG